MTTTPEAGDAVQVTDTGAGTATATVDREAIEAARATEADEQLLAGKFSTPEDLEKAYKELETKLGQQSQQPAEDEDDASEATDADATTDDEDKGKAPEDTETVYGKVVSDALASAEVDATAAAAEFEKEGTLSEDTFTKFAEAGFPKEVVEAYLRGVSAPVAEAEGLAQSQIDAIKGSVGGDEGFASLQEFISSQYTPEQKEAYNAAIGSGDFEKALGAVNAAKLNHAKEIGTETALLGGKAVNNGGFESEAAEREAMRDPRYKTSQAYRDEVAVKLMKSNYHVTR